MDIIGYQIFINLLVNHIKTIKSNMEQLDRTVILFTIFFHSIKIYQFFLFYDIM